MEHEELDLTPNVADVVLSIVRRTRGLTLFCGPTASGKSATAQAILRLIAPEREILPLDACRKTARPVDTWCVVDAGDIRLPDAAVVACEVALKTQVLGVLRSGESLGALHRLIDMGTDRALLRDVHPIVLTQRLCRRLCRSCRQPKRASQPQLAALDIGAQHLAITHSYVYDALGCERCESGYQGQVAIFEALEASVADDGTISANATWSTLPECGLLRVLCGATTLAELRRVLPT